MILPQIFRRFRRAGTISALYGMIVAQARLPGFYRDYGVPDTVNGRFDLIVLHLAVVLGRMAGQSGEFRELGQGLFDRFCQDMDHNLREMGVGDLAVPKEMNRIGEAYYGRSQAYAAALDGTTDDALSKALARNVFSQEGAAPLGAVRLAAYMRKAVAHLAMLDATALAAGALSFPDPALIPGET